MFFKDKILLDYVLELIGSRQYLNFNGMSYGEIPLVTLSGEFKIGFTTTISTLGHLVADNDDSLNRLCFRDDGTLFFVFNGAQQDLTLIDGGLVGDGLYHEFEFCRDSSSNVFLNVDGSLGTDVRVSSDLFMINSFASQWGGVTSVPLWSGILFDCYIEGDTSGNYPNPPSWPIANGFTLGATTPNINDPSGSTDMDLFNVLEGDWTTELP